MWSQPLFAELYRLLDPARPCALATYSRSTMLRVALLLAGFFVGTGDATDAGGNRSGQLDVVVEYPFAPSLPLGVGTTRLYLAEGVAAVVEVKSDAAGQTDDNPISLRQVVATKNDCICVDQRHRPEKFL